MAKINNDHEFTGKGPRKPHILVAPLDWGLGHATRCIPVIYELLKHNVEIWLAGEGAQQELLTREFPHLSFLPLEGYRVKYGRSRSALFRNMFLQGPRLLKMIRHENEWLKQAVKEYCFDAVISDNRFGLYHPEITSIFITHQLTIKSPFGKWSERFLQRNNYRFINRFTNCWVPDFNGNNNLAGELSHPPILPDIPVIYTGILSRLEKKSFTEKKGHLFISLSGPEPQRSILENILINELSRYNGTATVVRGLPGRNSIIPSTNDIQFYNHLPAEEYNKEIGMAEYVICRSGYSSIMDVVTLGKKAVLVPTPGQTEQEYLGQYLAQKKIAPCIIQKNFSLSTALEQARNFSYHTNYAPQTNNLSEEINSFISNLHQTIENPKSDSYRIKI